MKARPWLRSGAALVVAAAAAACVDLFHSTDFETLCARDPESAACSDDSGSPVATLDAAHPRVTDFCALDDAEIATVSARACAWLGACEGTFGESRYAACLARARYAYDCKANPSYRPTGVVASLWECLANVESCQAVDGCVFPDGVPSCALDARQGPFTACNSGTTGPSTLRLECSEDGVRPSAIDLCALGGRGCVVTSDTTACLGHLGQGNCTQKSYGCVDDANIVDCDPDAGVDHGIDCSGFGAGRCVTSSSGNSACAPSQTAASCSATPMTCKDDLIQGCVQGKAVSLDCARFGLTCANGTIVTRDVGLTDGGIRTAPVYDLLALCNPANDDCPAEDTCTNDGKSLRSCASGATVTLDCAGAGLGSCTARGGRASCGKPR